MKSQTDLIRLAITDIRAPKSYLHQCMNLTIALFIGFSLSFDTFAH